MGYQIIENLCYNSRREKLAKKAGEKGGEKSNNYGKK